MARIAIIGSRNYKHPNVVEHFVEQLPPSTVVVSGNARGVDRRAELAALQRDLEVNSFKADWKLFGKQAGVIRNVKMLKEADGVVAFWDGKSTGTLFSMRYASSLQMPVWVYHEDGRVEEYDVDIDPALFTKFDKTNGKFRRDGKHARFLGGK